MSWTRVKLCCMTNQAISSGVERLAGNENEQHNTKTTDNCGNSRSRVLNGFTRAHHLPGSLAPSQAFPDPPPWTKNLEPTKPS
jgi:hypothetical protein